MFAFLCVSEQFESIETIYSLKYCERERHAREASKKRAQGAKPEGAK